jgi:hypothetical protein
MTALLLCQIDSVPSTITGFVSVVSFFGHAPAAWAKRPEQPYRRESKIEKSYFILTGDKKVRSVSALLPLNCLVLHPFYR